MVRDPFVAEPVGGRRQMTTVPLLAASTPRPAVVTAAAVRERRDDHLVNDVGEVEGKPTTTAEIFRMAADGKTGAHRRYRRYRPVPPVPTTVASEWQAQSTPAPDRQQQRRHCCARRRRRSRWSSRGEFRNALQEEGRHLPGPDNTAAPAAPQPTASTPPRTCPAPPRGTRGRIRGKGGGAKRNPRNPRRNATRVLFWAPKAPPRLCLVGRPGQ